MTEAATPLLENAGTAADLEVLRQASAPAFDAVGWHYIEVLAAKTQTHSGTTQALLQAKLDKALGDLKARMAAAKHLTQTATPMATTTSTTASTAPAPSSPSTSTSTSPSTSPSPSPSPLALLLQEMAPLQQTPSTPATGKSADWRAESPRVQQFRKTLSKLSVQKQVTQAIAQAPQNAGPINSHMLVLRSLGLMRELSPDYLNRFMAYVDTLLCLEEAGKAKPLVKKPAARAKK